MVGVVVGGVEVGTETMSQIREKSLATYFSCANKQERPVGSYVVVVHERDPGIDKSNSRVKRNLDKAACRVLTSRRPQSCHRRLFND